VDSWNCLRYRMQPDTLYSIIADTKNIPDVYPASLTQTGGIICDDIHGLFPIDVLAVTWVPTCVLPFFTCTGDYIPWSCVDMWVDDDTNKKLANSPNLMLTAMLILAVGAFAEVAGHLFENWLYSGPRTLGRKSGSRIMEVHFTEIECVIFQFNSQETIIIQCTNSPNLI
jgi:hypothetical protein